MVKVPGVMEGWHTFGLWWKPDEYVFYVDGKETWRTKAGGVCQVPEYILLSDEIGKWGGDIKKAKLPDGSWWIMCGYTTWWRSDHCAAAAFFTWCACAFSAFRFCLIRFRHLSSLACRDMVFSLTVPGSN